MSEYAANPADVAEQQQSLDPEPGAEGAEAAENLDEQAVHLPDDANEADALEQGQVVPEDDEDYRE